MASEVEASDRPRYTEIYLRDHRDGAAPVAPLARAADRRRRLETAHARVGQPLCGAGHATAVAAPNLAHGRDGAP